MHPANHKLGSAARENQLDEYCETWPVRRPLWIQESRAGHNSKLIAENGLKVVDSFGEVKKISVISTSRS